MTRPVLLFLNKMTPTTKGNLSESIEGNNKDGGREEPTF